MKKPEIERLAEEFLHTEVNHDERHDSADHEKEMAALMKLLRWAQSDEREFCASTIESLAPDAEDQTASLLRRIAKMIRRGR